MKLEKNQTQFDSFELLCLKKILLRQNSIQIMHNIEGTASYHTDKRKQLELFISWNA